MARNDLAPALAEALKDVMMRRKLGEGEFCYVYLPSGETFSSKVSSFRAVQADQFTYNQLMDVSKDAGEWVNKAYFNARLRELIELVPFEDELNGCVPRRSTPNSTVKPTIPQIIEKQNKGVIEKEPTVKTDNNLTNEDIDEGNEKEFSDDELKYIEEINTFLRDSDLNLKASPATKGDGNCWFRALADQVVLQNIPDKARNHRSLRLEVCNHVKNLPEDIRENTINIVFGGKKKNLTDLICRQRKAGQWVDNQGIMVLTTAHYLARNIHIYSYPSESASTKYGLTKIEVGEQADSHPPLTVFFYDKHYQTLQDHVHSDNTNNATSDDISESVPDTEPENPDQLL